MKFLLPVFFSHFLGVAANVQAATVADPQIAAIVVATLSTTSVLTIPLCWVKSKFNN